MKRTLLTTALLIVMLTAILCIPVASVSAADDYNYFRINEDGVMLYSTTNSSSVLFEIPKTYFVQRNSSGDTAEFFSVAYNGISGYIAVSDAAKLSAPCKVDSGEPFFKTNVTAVQPAMFLLNPNDVSANEAITGGTALPFYGKRVVSDTTYYYVLHNNKYGYVPSTHTTTSKLTIAENTAKYTIKPIAPVTDPSVDESNGGTPENNLTRILLIVAICLLSLFIVFLLFKPVKNKHGRYEMKKQCDDDFDDDDYYR